MELSIADLNNDDFGFVLFLNMKEYIYKYFLSFVVFIFTKTFIM